MKEHKKINRRKFITAASAGAAAAVIPGGNYLSGMAFQPKTKLAVLGGERLRKTSFIDWPQSSSTLEELLVQTAKSGNWYRFERGARNVSTFENKFAELIGN